MASSSRANHFIGYFTNWGGWLWHVTVIISLCLYHNTARFLSNAFWLLFSTKMFVYIGAGWELFSEMLYCFQQTTSSSHVTLLALFTRTFALWYALISSINREGRKQFFHLIDHLIKCICFFVNMLQTVGLDFNCIYNGVFV